jgi:D-alanyl-D-alanine carboxypeptidase/D-alanyl-D-alanine-endopeptidase (penicillin-binding protein 4)
VTATTEGQPATVVVRPESSAFTVRVDVDTVGEDGDTVLGVEADSADPRALVVTGTIAEGHSQLALHRVPDAGAWARTLFVEALGRAGVGVSAPAVGPNVEVRLPAPGASPGGPELASIQSPPIKEIGRAIVEMSFNLGANAFLCLLAVERGSTDCHDGLVTIDALVEKAGLDPKAVVLVDGQGADPASATPRQMARWMRWARAQPWGEQFEGDQPVLGETGSLAANLPESPAKGKVAAKVGTSVVVDPVSGRLYSKVQSLAGYLTLEDGRELVFALSTNGATYDEVYDGLVESGDDVAGVAAAFQQALS